MPDTEMVEPTAVSAGDVILDDNGSTFIVETVRDEGDFLVFACATTELSEPKAGGMVERVAKAAGNIDEYQESAMTRLARVYVPPHGSVSKSGRPQSVKGYFQNREGLANHMRGDHKVPKLTVDGSPGRQLQSNHKLRHKKVANPDHVHDPREGVVDVGNRDGHKLPARDAGTTHAGVPEAKSKLDALENTDTKEFYRPSDTILRQTVKGKGVIEIKYTDSGKWQVNSAKNDKDGAMWHGQGDFDTYEKAHARFLKLRKGTLGTKIVGLSDETKAVERLVKLVEATTSSDVSLTRIYVPPHTRVSNGSLVHVDGYWRTGSVDSLTRDERRAIAETVPAIQYDGYSDDSPARHAFFEDAALHRAIRDLNAKQGSEPPELNLKSGRRQELVDAVRKSMDNSTLRQRLDSARGFQRSDGADLPEDDSDPTSPDFPSRSPAAKIPEWNTDANKTPADEVSAQAQYYADSGQWISMGEVRAIASQTGLDTDAVIEEFSSAGVRFRADVHRMH